MRKLATTPSITEASLCAGTITSKRNRCDERRAAGSVYDNAVNKSKYRLTAVAGKARRIRISSMMSIM